MLQTIHTHSAFRVVSENDDVQRAAATAATAAEDDNKTRQQNPRHIQFSSKAASPYMDQSSSAERDGTRLVRRRSSEGSSSPSPSRPSSSASATRTHFALKTAGIGPVHFFCMLHVTSVDMLHHRRRRNRLSLQRKAAGNCLKPLSIQPRFFSHRCSILPQLQRAHRRSAPSLALLSAYQARVPPLTPNENNPKSVLFKACRTAIAPTSQVLPPLN